VDAQTAESLLTFAETASPQLRGLQGKAAREQLEQQYSDLLSALDWFIAQERIDEAFRLANSLVPFWMATRCLDEGVACFDRALEVPGGDDARRSRALYDAGYLIFWTGDDVRASSLQHDALVLARRVNNPTVTALVLAGLARTALRTDIEEARRLCREALAVTGGTGDQVGRSSAMHVLAVASQMAGDFPEARDMMRRRMALGRQQGDLVTVSSEAANLSMVERQLGNLDEADALAREAMDIAYRRGDELMTGWIMNGFAAVARDRGEFERAATLIGCADAALEAAGGAWPPDELVHYEQTVATLTEKMGSEEFERVRAAGHSMTLPEAVEFALGTGPAQ